MVKKNKKHLSRKVTGLKNVTHRILPNPLYNAYNYYFRYFIKENNNPFCICVFNGSVNKKCHPQVEKGHPKGFYKGNTR